MMGIARLEVGQPLPDGTRPYAVVDSTGRLWRGLLDDPELVHDYLDYLDSVGRTRPVVTGAATTGPEEPQDPAAGPEPATFPPAPFPERQAGFLVATAARAPSVHNTQPWRFRVTPDALELYADPTRRLPRADPAGREMLISCGAALFGLRLAIRRLGHLPLVRLLPSQAKPDLLARVQLGPPVPMTGGERALLAAASHRFTHRGPFAPGPLPPGLLAGLQRDAAEEGATLVVLGRRGRDQHLARLVAAAERWQHRNPALRAERRRWTRPPGSRARDGIPARAYPTSPARPPEALALRDFDLGRGWGQLPGGGASPAVTAVLTTAGDGRADWLRAGQALHRLLIHSATRWVFASLHTQPLESAVLRAEVRTRLALAGAPQMLLQLGPSAVTQTTARRPVSEVMIHA